MWNCGHETENRDLQTQPRSQAEFDNWVVAMPIGKTPNQRDHDLEAEALEALEAARAMPHGTERTRALKKAGDLRNAADRAGFVFAKRGRPRKG